MREVALDSTIGNARLQELSRRYGPLTPIHTDEDVIVVRAAVSDEQIRALSDEPEVRWIRCDRVSI